MGKFEPEIIENIRETKKELKKHAATIHCSNSLSLLQRKISNALLYHAYPDLMQHEEHEITVKQLCRLIGYQGNNHAVIKDALRELISTIIEWNLTDEITGEDNWTASTIIASVSLQGPVCYYAYSPRMKQLLYSPSMFGKIDLLIQSQFRSSYGLALYENCTRYRGLPHTKWFDMALFKKLMGVPDGKYNIFRDFKRRVLDKAIDEVNMYSDLLVQSELIKEGKKVSKIRFKLKDRAKRTRLGKIIEITESTALSNDLINKLKNDYLLSNEQIEQIFENYTEEFVTEKINLIEVSKAYQMGGIKSLSAYLLSALKQNYQAKKRNEHEHKTKKNNIEQKINFYAKKVELICQQYNQAREENIYASIERLETNKRIAFMNRFYEYADAAIQIILQLQRGKYTRETILESPHIKAQLRQFALRELDNLELKPIDEYVLGLTAEQQEAWYELKKYDPNHSAFKLI